MELSQSIKNQALSLGFDRVAITSAQSIRQADLEALTNWLEKNYAADLKYMQKNVVKRTNPSRFLHNAQSIICVALHYKPPPTPPAPGCVKIADFALYEDYHPFIKERLFRLAKWIQSQLPADLTWNYKVCVDTAPLAERALAARAGLGFIGKNHMLIHPELGSRLLLGELVTTLALPVDKPIRIDPCRHCNACIRACPTGALQEDGFFDANRCISYLTQYSSNPSEWTQAISNRLFGCDTCLQACPYERQAPPTKNSDFRFYPERTNLRPEDILEWDQRQFNKIFENSCIHRTGLEKLKKNAQICAANRGTTSFDEK